jgi:PEP-CTERM motif
MSLIKPRRLAALRFYSATIVATITAVAGVIAPALAAPMTQNYTVDFSSPTQSIWGPGQDSADFGYDHYVLGNSTFGLRFATGASSGTVSANYDGSLSVSYDSSATAGLVPLTIGYAGSPNGGHYATSLGAYVDVTAYFPVPVVGTVPVTITNPNYSLHTGATFTPSPPDHPTGSDSFTPASTSIGPDIDVLSGQAGIHYDIDQNSDLAIGALSGTATAVNETTHDTRTASFSLGSSDPIALDLDETGLWDVTLGDLALPNTFSTQFSLGLRPFISYYIGLGCGDLSTDSDNGLLCGGDGELSTTLASVNLFSNTPFGLALTTNAALPSFQIDVSAPTTPVPEPGSLLLLASSLVGLTVVRRRRDDGAARQAS